MITDNKESKQEQIEEHSEMCNIPDGIIKSMKADIAEIKTALLGNKYQRRGLIERVELLEKEVDNFKKLKWVVFGGASVIASVTTIIIRLLVGVI